MTAGTELPAYLPYPRFLLKMDISHTAKLLYALLLDRSTLSQKNGWQDSEGRTYIIIQKHPASVKRVPYSMRQDLILLDKLDAETRFLAKHEYGSLVELESHKEKSTGRISELEQERNALRSQLRTAARREDAPAVENLKSRIKEVSSEIKTLRQEVKLCEGIEARSALMERNLEQLQQEQEIERKEEEQHELFRRGGRSGHPFEPERR